MALVRQWAAMKGLAGSAPGAAPLLPRSGGFGEQQALTMDAFAMFERWVDQRRNRNAGHSA
jgi:hypothetical protein